MRQPSLKELVQAATTLGYSPEPREGAGRPGTSWDKTGYVVIRKPGPRVATFRLIAAEIVKARQRETQQVITKQAKR